MSVKPDHPPDESQENLYFQREKKPYLTLDSNPEPQLTVGSLKSSLV
jgi:hypothetical protein